MRYNPDKHHRKSVRLKAQDYAAAGRYFITICTYQRQCLLGEIVAGEVQLSELGHVAAACWQAIPEHFAEVVLDEFVVMPNHVHGILVLGGGGPTAKFTEANGHPGESDSRTFGKMVPGSIPAIVRAFKSAATRQINQLRGAAGCVVWQRGYYDHVIRDRQALAYIQHYIVNNPRQWQIDQLHPDHPSKW